MNTMNTLPTAAVAVAALVLSGLSGPAEARTASCQSHAKAGVVCTDSPLYVALNLPRVNGR